MHTKDNTARNMAQPDSPTLTPLRIAVIGMGGFAGTHHDAVMKLQQQQQCRLVCACDPLPGNFLLQRESWQFEQHGVKVYDDYRTMLNAHASELDLVTIPTPVPVHVEMHRLAVELGIPVYLEKPPTLDIVELNNMLHVEQKVRRETNVGFNFIMEQQRQELKRRLLAGEFGKLLKVGFTGLWPRTRAYYQRAPWAGRLMLNDHIVLDSPIGNALAHYVHNVLYWAGTAQIQHWADITWVQAELYRAHDIEGADTVFLTASTDNGVLLEIAVSHACEGESKHREWLVCENAIINYTTYRSYEIMWNNGRSERDDLSETTLLDNIAAHCVYLRSKSQFSRPVTRLADCQPFVTINDLAYISSASIFQIPENYLRIHPSTNSETVAINNIDAIVNTFIESGRFPSQQGISWAYSGKVTAVTELTKLPTVIHEMMRKVT